MQIFWHGFSSVRIETKAADTGALLVTDPYANDTGIRFPKTLEPDLVLLSDTDRKRFNLDALANAPFVVSEPGEYEKAGIFARGIALPEGGGIVYRIDAEDMSVAFLGALNRPLTSDAIELLGDIDILIVPVGGGTVLDASAAQHAVEAVEPRIVIPVHYAIPGVKETLDSVDAFCKVLGSCSRENVNKLKISQKDLPQDTMKVVVIERA